MLEEGEVQVENVEETAPATEQTGVDISQEVSGVESPTANGEVLDDVDEKGVSFKNRAAEYQRKYHKLAEEVESLKQTIVQPEVKQEYTIADLEEYALQNPEQRALVEQEKEKVRASEMMRLLDEREARLKQQQQIEQLRVESVNYVKSNYPDLFEADGTFNYMSPLFQEVETIMKDPRIAQSPDGLQVAADLAYGRIARRNSGSVEAKIQQKEDENRALQRKTFVEGSGKSAPSATPHQQKLNKAIETGHTRDAAKAIGSIFRQQGILSDT